MGTGAGGAGNVVFLLNNQQPMLQELGKQNPPLMLLIQEHQADFVLLLNEPVEGGEGFVLLSISDPKESKETPVSWSHAAGHSSVPEEREAVEQFEAAGFDRPIVLEMFFAFDKNEELAANYFLDHMQELED
ncbi:hypothetical protein SAY86_008351 [Trapa natans]|uniref:Ubiquitin receptor RAD23 n=1 Tax=Trapa natans TaxID=22666 RepID=A0AAN7K668_TRANT|nr:hypothetical protein SAY86_008351 [Trapa natans]